MDVNMYLKHVMIDMVASGCSWMREYTLDTRLTRSRFMLHMHEYLYLFMDEIECVIMRMLHMVECLCTHIVYMTRTICIHVGFMTLYIFLH